MTTQQDFSTLLSKGAVEVAQSLIGWQLYVKEPNGTKVGGAIIETEAYTQADAASHTYRGLTKRNATMFGPAGRVYVYFTYGMHWCMNIVTGVEGKGEGVLIRSILPESGIELIRARRNGQRDALLTNGPAKICQALDVTGLDDGSVINQSRFIITPPKYDQYVVSATERIGISQDQHRLWRFVATTDESYK